MNVEKEKIWSLDYNRACECEQFGEIVDGVFDVWLLYKIGVNPIHDVFEFQKKRARQWTIIIKRGTNQRQRVVLALIV